MSRKPARKPFWQSKTFWLNAILLAIAIVDLLSKQGLGVAAGTWGFVTSILNLLLRFTTNQGLSMTRAPESDAGDQP